PSDASAADEEIDMTVAVEVAGNDDRPTLRESRQGARIPVKVARPFVDVEAVLKGIVMAPELVAAAHHIEIRMRVAIRVDADACGYVGKERRRRVAARICIMTARRRLGECQELIGWDVYEYLIAPIRPDDGE